MIRRSGFFWCLWSLRKFSARVDLFILRKRKQYNRSAGECRSFCSMERCGEFFRGVFRLFLRGCILYIVYCIQRMREKGIRLVYFGFREDTEPDTVLSDTSEIQIPLFSVIAVLCGYHVLVCGSGLMRRGGRGLDRMNVCPYAKG